MRNLLSGLAIAAILTVSGTASAEVLPGYYRFDLMHFVVLNGSGTPLSDVQKKRVEEIFEKCDVAPDYDPVRGPLGIDEKNALIDKFRRCVHTAIFETRWKVPRYRDNLFPNGYLLLEGTDSGRPGHIRR